MGKEELMKIRNTKDFLNAIIRMGYSECGKKGGSHKIYKCLGRGTLSIPVGVGKELSTGVKRTLVKLILGNEYYIK
jgi:predicted RNA binding protein YcfA (HicA-like mRNA interferase family)